MTDGFDTGPPDCEHGAYAAHGCHEMCKCGHYCYEHDCSWVGRACEHYLFDHGPLGGECECEAFAGAELAGG